MVGYWSNRTSDPNGKGLILAIEPNGAPPGAALWKVIGNHRWKAVCDIIREKRERRCEKCGSGCQVFNPAMIHCTQGVFGDH